MKEYNYNNSVEGFVEWHEKRGFPPTIESPNITIQAWREGFKRGVKFASQQINAASNEVECWYCHKKYGKGHKCSTCGRVGR